MNNIIKVELKNGKYTMVYDEETHTLKTLRYGEEWRDHTGDKLMNALFDKILEYKLKVEYEIDKLN